MGAEPKLTDGIISSLTGIGNDPCTYQIGVPVQAGNSGGPLLNVNGEVIGIVTSKLSAAEMFKRTNDITENANYAVKIVYLNALLLALPNKHPIAVQASKRETLSSKRVSNLRRESITQRIRNGTFKPSLDNEAAVKKMLEGGARKHQPFFRKMKSEMTRELSRKNDKYGQEIGDLR